MCGRGGRCQMWSWMMQTAPIENIIIIIGVVVMVFGIISIMNRFERWLRKHVNI